MFQSMDSFADTEVQRIQFINSQELLAVLVASASILSLSGSYQDNDVIREIYIPRDLVNLTFGVPLLFASAYESSLIPGVLAYQLYSSLTCVLAFWTSPGWVFFLHLIVLWMCASKFWETTEGFQTLFSRDDQATNAKKATKEEEDRNDRNGDDDGDDDESESSNKPLPFKYAGFIVLMWGIVVSLRSSLRMELLVASSSFLPTTESAVDATQFLLGAVWMFGGMIQLCRWQHSPKANPNLGFCLLLQLSAFIYSSLLILLVRYCVMIEKPEDDEISSSTTTTTTTTHQVEDAAALGIMAMSVILPLERFFSHLSSLRSATTPPKVLEG
ncbi:MAG: hypothetical protein SGBAC_011678 [Bacillariaceae sp.]